MSSLSVNTATTSYSTCSALKSTKTFSGPISRSSVSNADDMKIIPANMYTTKLEEEIGTNKSGMITGYMAYTKSSRKTYYAILSNRCFELHDNIKNYKKKKAAKYIFDLATCFNISEHEDAKLKTTVSIMTPDETFVFKATEEDKSRDDKSTLEWLDAMLHAVVPARALFLGRPVLITEFFEYCWDVTLVSKPRIRKPIPNPENFENICLKRPELAKRHRLGFYPQKILLCDMGIQPSLYGRTPKPGDAPFNEGDYFEIQRQFVASFGFQERYFIMRIGRAASTGMCEIWAQCESEEVAANIHMRLNQIIEREAEKKRQGQQQIYSNDSTHQFLGSSSTNSLGEISSNSPKKMIPEVHSSVSLSSGRKSILKNKNLVSTDEENDHVEFSVQKYGTNRCAKSIDQAILKDIKRTDYKTHESQRAHTIGSQHQTSSSWLNSLRKNSHKKEEQDRQSMSPVVEWAKQALVSGSTAADEETEDSGGTLKVVDYEEHEPRTNHNILIDGLYPHEKLLESVFDRDSDFLCSYRQRGSISSSNSSVSNARRRQLTIGSDSGKGDDLDHDGYNRSTPDDSSSLAADESSLSDVVGYQRNHYDEACSTTSSLSVDNPDCKVSTSYGSVTHLLQPTTNIEQQRFEDIKSYISDSSDSCYSSINTNSYLNQQRAMSFTTSNKNQTTYEFMQPLKLSNEKNRIDEACSSIDNIQLGEEAATTMSKSVRIQENPSSSQYLTPKEDLRKRAFSLGSKSWITKPFRKLSQTQNRLSNHGSKASSISGDTESCNESIISNHSHSETIHNRSDSMDSTISHPMMNRKISSNTLKKNKIDDHLIEVDFPSSSSKSNSQRSIISQQCNTISNNRLSNSIDSPIRSRTSSFVANNLLKSSGENLKKYADNDDLQEKKGIKMQEVRCFIQSGDDDIMNILSSSKDNMSVNSLRNDNHYHQKLFETIEENCNSPNNSSRSSSRLSRKSLDIKDNKIKIQQPIHEINYATIMVKSVNPDERKPSIPITKKVKNDIIKKSASHEHS